jgi:hypothetical protein
MLAFFEDLKLTARTKGHGSLFTAQALPFYSPKANVSIG